MRIALKARIWLVYDKSMLEEGVPDFGKKNGLSNVRGVPAASYPRTTGVPVAQRYAERYIGVTPSFLHGVL